MNTSNENHGAKPPDQPRFADAASLSQTPDLPDWLVKPLLIAGQRGVVAGARKKLQTSLVLDLVRLPLKRGTVYDSQTKEAKNRLS
jgi:hypothetical protein